ncbi:hypothetical protein [Bradyrhizobium sp.]|uniref:hypothetical protein n=1 Tax=Bradyrhizobium sp. TaxID=376 RepID=UPI0025BB1CC8|nr:hypothetical protein [Bradyrhizobium sp.]
MAFRVGQKVVCIVDGWPPIPSVVWPSKGGIYTVREMLGVGEEPSLRLYEIQNPIVEYSNVSPREVAFVIWAFRPLVDSKTDISIFTAMLTDSKIGADA